jgi:hypothetical protein
MSEQNTLFPEQNPDKAETQPENLEPIVYPPLDPKITVKTVMVDPEMARNILKKSRYNRAISPSTVRRYIRDMRALDWVFNGQAVIFNGSPEDTEGELELLNGGHRLTAVMEGNVTVPLLFVSGIVPVAIHTMDTGRGRSFAQMLAIDGKVSPEVLASMISIVHNYREHGDWKGRKYSTSVLYKTLEKEGERAEEVAKERNHKNQGKLSKGLLAALDYLFGELNPVQAKAFCDAIRDGINLDKDDPRYAAREWLIRTKDDDEYDSQDVAWVLIEAWNRFRAGEKWSKVKSVPSTKPEIQ